MSKPNNVAPVVVDDSYSVYEGGILTVAAAGALLIARKMLTYC